MIKIIMIMVTKRRWNETKRSMYICIYKLINYLLVLLSTTICAISSVACLLLVYYYQSDKYNSKEEEEKRHFYLDYTGLYSTLSSSQFDDTSLSSYYIISVSQSLHSFIHHILSTLIKFPPPKFLRSVWRSAM